MYSNMSIYNHIVRNLQPVDQIQPPSVGRAFWQPWTRIDSPLSDPNHSCWWDIPKLNLPYIRYNRIPCWLIKSPLSPHWKPTLLSTSCATNACSRLYPVRLKLGEDHPQQPATIIFTIRFFRVKTSSFWILYWYLNMPLRTSRKYISYSWGHKRTPPNFGIL